MRIISDIEIGNHPEHTLLLFILDLRFRHFSRGKGDLHIRDIGGNGQCNLRNSLGLSRTQYPGGCLRRESCRRYCELKSSGGDIDKEELSVAACYNFIAGRSMFLRQLHAGSGNHGPAFIDDRSADASGCDASGG